MEKDTSERTKTTKAIPQPPGSMCFGNTFQINPAKIHVELYSLMKEYGEIFRLNFSGENIVFINSADLCRDAFSKVELLGRKDNFYAVYILFGMRCISNAHWTETTKALRKMELSLIDSHSKMLVSHEHLLQAELTRFETSLMETVGQDTNISALIGISVGNTLSVVLDGREPTPAKTETIVNFYVRSLFKDGLLFLLTKFPFLRHLPGRAGSVYRELIRTRDNMLEVFVDDDADGRGYVRNMLKLIAEERAKTDTDIRFTDDHIRGLVADLRAGAFAPISENLCMMFLCLMKHPEIMRKIQLEIDEVLGEDAPSLKYRSRMHLTQAVVLETLRYGSMVPISLAHVATSDVEVSGYVIQRGTQVFGNLFGMNYDEDIWGDPFTFRPERFLDADGTLLPPEHRLRTASVPFSAGVRTCTGRDFVLSRMFMYVTSVLRRFDMCESDAKPLPDPDPQAWNYSAALESPDIVCSVRLRENRH